MNKIIKIILFCLGLSLLFFLLHHVGFKETIRHISEANPVFLFLGVLSYFIVISIRSFKWFILIRVIDPEVKYRKFLPFYLVNTLIGNTTPFKSGEAVTPFLFKRYLKIPVGRGFFVVILDRFLELMTFVIILILVFFYILNRGIENGLVLSVFKWLFAVFFLILIFLIIVAVSRKIVLKVVSFFKKYSFLKRIFEFIEKELNVFYEALPLFKNKGIYQTVVPLTLLGWLFDFLAFYFIFSSVFSIYFMDIVVAQVINVGASLITFIPGGLGVSEISSVYMLSLFGHSIILSTAAILLVRLLLTGFLLIFGLIGSLLLKEKKNN